MSNKRVGLDTSVVLRLLVGEPVDQAEVALNYLSDLRASGKRGTVSDLVVSETYFALQYHYGVPKQQALDTMASFLSSPEVEGIGSAPSVLQQPKLGQAKPGFVDRLIHAEYASDGGAMVSFEKAAKKLPEVTVL